MTAEELAALHATCFTTPRPWSAQEFTSFEDSAFLLRSWLESDEKTGKAA